MGMNDFEMYDWMGFELGVFSSSELVDLCTI